MDWTDEQNFLDWTDGQDYWTGLMDKITGLDDDGLDY